MLYTLVADDSYSTHVSELWNIFYHYLLDDKSYTLLVAQCRKLAKLSADWETWNTSEYSSLLKVCSRLTLAELHRMWELYAATDSFTVTQKAQTKTAFIQGMKRTADKNIDPTYSSVRAAGLFFPDAIEVGGFAYRHFQQKTALHSRKRMKSNKPPSSTQLLRMQRAAKVSWLIMQLAPFSLSTSQLRLRLQPLGSPRRTRL